MAMSAFRHWRRVFATGGLPRTARTQSSMSFPLSNCTRYVVLYLIRSPQFLELGAVQHRPSRSDPLALVRVLDLQPPG